MLWHKNLYYCHKRCKFFSLKYIHDNSWITFYVLQKEFCFINSWFHMCCLCDRSPSPLGSLLYVQCHQSPGAGCRRGKVSCCLMNHDWTISSKKSTEILIPKSWLKSVNGLLLLIVSIENLHLASHTSFNLFNTITIFTTQTFSFLTDQIFWRIENYTVWKEFKRNFVLAFEVFSQLLMPPAEITIFHVFIPALLSSSAALLWLQDSLGLLWGLRHLGGLRE